MGPGHLEQLFMVNRRGPTASMLEFRARLGGIMLGYDLYYVPFSAHEVGLVTLQVSCNGLVISNSVLFEYKNHPQETDKIKQVIHTL